jgi:RbsD / FucU transport protein family
MNQRKFTLVALLALTVITVAFVTRSWCPRLKEQLPLLGHRNWIVVADSAYPLQTAPGIETIYVAADQLTVVKSVLAELAQTKHVQPTIYTDAEMKFVAEKNAPGMGAYRAGLEKLLAAKPVQVLPHEQIIAKLDEAGKTFKVLLIKTPLTLPYTSVFFQLECGYWNAESEKELREAMKAAK